MTTSAHQPIKKRNLNLNMKSLCKIFKSVWGRVLIPCLALSCLTASYALRTGKAAAEGVAADSGNEASGDYLDTSLPREIKTAPYEGERYQVEIPATIDLVAPAERAINVLTSALEPRWDYEQYFVLYIDVNPPHFEMGHGGLLNINAKWLEALPMLRSMTGSVHFTPQAAINWYRLTGNESALDLGRGLANYLSRHGRMIDPDTGEPLMDHFAHLSHSLTANTAYAIGAKDKEMIKWARRGFEYQIRTRDPNGTGILISDPTCSCYPADMIDVGILLSRAGEGDYWDRVDGWVRNTLLDLQIVEEDVERVKAMPKKMKDLPPGNIQLADGADRVLGGFLHSINPQNRNRAIGCCNGNCSRALYLVWDSIMDTGGRDLRVNLLMNRASAVADLHSYLPYEGRVVIDVKKSRKNVLVRIPEWTDYNKIECRVEGSSRSFGWDGNYINLGSVGKGGNVEVHFPLRTRTLPMDYLTLIPGVKYSPENIMAGRILKKTPVAVTLKGNTVIDIVPNPGYPMERHAKYRAENIDMKTVERFVTEESYIW